MWFAARSVIKSPGTLQGRETLLLESTHEEPSREKSREEEMSGSEGNFIKQGKGTKKKKNESR